MNKTKIQIEKEAVAHLILKNPTYTKESGLYKRIHQLLTIFSLTDLRDLCVIINCKEHNNE